MPILGEYFFTGAAATVTTIEADPRRTSLRIKSWEDPTLAYAAWVLIYLYNDQMNFDGNEYYIIAPNEEQIFRRAFLEQPHIAWHMVGSDPYHGCWLATIGDEVEVTDPDSIPVYTKKRRWWKRE